jgi:hypothetical protein
MRTHQGKQRLHQRPMPCLRAFILPGDDVSPPETDQCGRATVKLGNDVGLCWHCVTRLLLFFVASSVASDWLLILNMTELLITVTVTYGGDKARSLVPRCTSQRDVVETLRTDFTAMGVPHPKAESIVLHSVGRITCFWRTQDTNVCGLLCSALASLKLEFAADKKEVAADNPRTEYRALVWHQGAAIHVSLDAENSYAVGFT